MAKSSSTSGHEQSSNVTLDIINLEMRLTTDDKQAMNMLAEELANKDLNVLAGLLADNY